MKVQVLMSSYNGEKYIREQIESILNQQGVEVSVLIRDDGSKDSTRKILDEINDKRVTCVYEENIGVKKSFLKLIEMSDPEVEYYAFSDQDDIWLPNKLWKAINTLSYQDRNIPLIYGSPVNLYVKDKIVGKQFTGPSPKLGNFLVKNYYPGCTMVFNAALCELIKKIDYRELNPFPLHDHWLNLVCTACGGKVIMDSESYILYRQHNSNVVGDRNILQKIKGNGLLTHSNHIRYKTCVELNELYREWFCIEASDMLDTVLKYREGAGYRIRLALNKKVKPFTAIEKISLTLIVLLGKF